MIRVLVIDGSALARQVLAQALANDPDIEAVGTASERAIALKKIARLEPDVITLDLELPGGGLSFLGELLSCASAPVVAVSLKDCASETALKAVEMGAYGLITWPSTDITETLPRMVAEMIEKIKAAARDGAAAPRARIDIPLKLSADVILSRSSKTSARRSVGSGDKVVVIGASTGGTEALMEVLATLPANAPGICVVQHMPRNFTRSFSERLDAFCRVDVKEAKNGDVVRSGQALIAPGDYHMLLRRSGGRYYVELNSGPPVNRHRPSVDVLFRSASKYAGRNAVGIILTGMGDDGARGLKEMKEAGALTIAQDESSCVVFGMPKEAIRLGAVDRVLPLGAISGAIANVSNNPQHAAASLLESIANERG